MEQILVVEDDRAIRHLVTEILKSSGYAVDSAVDGLEAVGTAGDLGAGRSGDPLGEREPARADELDRVAAIGGTLRLESPAGQGTLAIAEIPIGWPADLVRCSHPLDLLAGASGGDVGAGPGTAIGAVGVARAPGSALGEEDDGEAPVLREFEQAVLLAMVLLALGAGEHRVVVRDHDASRAVLVE